MCLLPRNDATSGQNILQLLRSVRMQRLLWSVDEDQDNVHVLCATMEEKAEMMGKGNGASEQTAV